MRVQYSGVSRVLGGSALALVGLLAGCTTYHPDSYAGDGTMIVMPSGPGRYDLELRSIDLARPGRYEFQLSGLPSDSLLAVLAMDEPSERALRELDARGSRVTMTLRELNRDLVSAKSGLLLGDWGTTPESWNGQPVEFQGMNFRARRHDFYILEIEVAVDRADPSAPRVPATPRVRGGGLAGVF